MNRRALLSMFALTGLAVASPGMSASRAPLVSLALRRDQQPVFVRLYSGAGPDRFVAMVRRPDGDTWHDVRVSAGSLAAIGAGVESGALSVGQGNRKLDLKFAVNGAAVSGTITGSGGNADDFQAQMDPVTGGVAILGIVATVAVVAIVAKSGGGSVSVETPMGSAEVKVGEGGKKEGGDTPKEGEGFMADPACDQFPKPLNC